MACSGFFYLAALLALWGAAVMWRKKECSTATLAPLFVLGLTLAHMLVEVSGRYHYSVIPMLVIIAAHFCGGKGGDSHDRTEKAA